MAARKPDIPKFDSLTVRAMAVEADVDVRTFQKELNEPGSVRGRPAERIRAVLARRNAERKE